MLVTESFSSRFVQMRAAAGAVAILLMAFAGMSCGPVHDSGDDEDDPVVIGETGGSGSSGSSTSGSTGGSSNTDCFERCITKVESCAPNRTRGDYEMACNQLGICDRSDWEQKLTCFENMDCNAQTDQCGLTSGGSGSSGGSTGGSSGGTTTTTTTTGGSSGSSTGGSSSGGSSGGSGSCPIPEGDLKVQFPYIMKSIPTVVDVGGYCQMGSSKGKNSASVLASLELLDTDGYDETTLGSVQQLEFGFTQVKLTAADKSNIASVTGIPNSEIQRSKQLVVKDKPVQFRTPLPDGVKYKAFLESTYQGGGYIRFYSGDVEAYSELKRKLQGEITATIPFGLKSHASGNNPTYRYTLRLSDSKMELTNLSVE